MDGDWGIFKRCPVDGPNDAADNFGIMCGSPGCRCTSQGNDIGAADGTPIVAPFDGIATASSSELAGLEVRVTGTRATSTTPTWLLRPLGSVRLVNVIGYVGQHGRCHGAARPFRVAPRATAPPSIPSRYLLRRRLLDRGGSDLRMCRVPLGIASTVPSRPS